MLKTSVTTQFDEASAKKAERAPCVSLNTVGELMVKPKKVLSTS